MKYDKLNESIKKVAVHIEKLKVRRKINMLIVVTKKMLYDYRKL